jgi:hypothetical protein
MIGGGKTVNVRVEQRPRTVELLLKNLDDENDNKFILRVS